MCYRLGRGYLGALAGGPPPPLLASREGPLEALGKLEPDREGQQGSPLFWGGLGAPEALKESSSGGGGGTTKLCRRAIECAPKPKEKAHTPCACAYSAAHPTTLNPEPPLTLNSYTLNPKLLNPEPSTLNPPETSGPPGPLAAGQSL